MPVLEHKQTFQRVIAIGMVWGLAVFGVDRVTSLQNRILNAYSRLTTPTLIDVPLTKEGEALLPDPRRTPDEVVRIQVEAMNDADLNRSVRQCFVFASPGNQLMNGPLPRFAQLLSQPPYDYFHNERAQWVIGSPVVQGGEATVLVSLLPGTDDPPIHLFRFELSRQKLGTLRDCWMTDAVQEIPALTWSERDGQ